MLLEALGKVAGKTLKKMNFKNMAFDSLKA
jgi:hypothetical protein